MLLKSLIDGAAHILPYVYAFLFIIIVWQAAVVFSNAHVTLLPPPLLVATSLDYLGIHCDPARTRHGALALV